MDLGFDIDGVISDFVRSFASVVKKHYDLDLAEEDIHYHDLDLVLGISKEERDKLIRETLLQDLPLIAGAKKALVKLHSGGHQIVILTARPRDMVKVTKEWLKKKGIPYSQFIQLHEGEKHVAGVNLNLVVEDNLEDAIGWSQKVKNILVYDHPWNRSFNVKDLFKRVHNWNDVLEEIKRVERCTVIQGS